MQQMVRWLRISSSPSPRVPAVCGLAGVLLMAGVLMTGLAGAIPDAAAALPDGAGAIPDADPAAPGIRSHAGPAALGAATAQLGNAAELTERAAKLIQADRLNEALELLEQALQENDRYWEAHYQRGRALGLRGEFAAARDALLRAAALNPGHGHTHRLAAVAAIRIEDWGTAWDQAINATLAGEDMNQVFFQLYEASEVPANFETRIQAARVFVGRPDASEVEARAELPYNRNPKAAEGPGRGGVGTISGRPADVMGRERLQERIADIDRMQRLVRELLIEHPRFGVVLEPEQADLILGISIDELGETAPVRMEGYLRLYDTVSGEAVYYREIELRDITQEAMMHGELTRYFEDLGKWVATWKSETG